MKIADLVQEVDERNPPDNAVVFSVSEKLGIVPQSQLFTKQIATTDRSKYRRVQFGDVIYNPYLLWNRAIGVCFDQSGGCVSPAYIVLRPRERGTERFLHYFFRSDRLTSAVNAIASGSVTRRRTAPVADILNLTFDLPALAQQKAANLLLGSIDRKIELVQETNGTLEAMAHAIFKAWFVDFDPVRAKVEGRDPGMHRDIADLFPDGFDKSGSGQIPKGWRLLTVTELTEINAWTLGKNDELDRIEYIEISEVTRGNIANIRVFPRGEEPSRARRRLRHGDTVLSTVRPQRGSYFLCLNPSPNLIASTGFAVISPTKAPWSFVHAATTQPAFFEHLGQYADGGAYPAVRPEIVGKWNVPLPDKPEILEEFHRTCAPLYERAEQNRCQSRTTAALRDILLPKLISGERPISAEAMLSTQPT